MSTLVRVTEPELMDDPAQVDAYASADWSDAHDRLMRELALRFPRESLSGVFLDLGCGPGDDTFRFLRDFPRTRVSCHRWRVADDRTRARDAAQRVFAVP